MTKTQQFTVLLLITFTLAFGQTPFLQLWEDFKTQYNKSYPTEADEQFRFQVFQASMERAREMNSKQSYASYGITPFSDLTPREFRERYLMTISFDDLPDGPVMPKITNVNLPASFDWRDKSGIVTPVKNQGQCGSCWAFSATETIESVWAIAGHGLREMSPQQIVDCDTGSDGCRGGYPYTAYEYVQATGGLESEQAYPYVAYDERCHFNRAGVVADVTGWEYVTRTLNELQMQNAVYSYAPLSICVDAQLWQDYRGGVVTRGTCGKSLDHCVQITGWTEIQGVPAWIVRNSWGTAWGNNGYIYIQMGYDVLVNATNV